jgi:phosphoserine phosphatase
VPTEPPFDRIVFDCDSTLSRIEGIDELARAAPQHRAAIEELTSRAMAGELPLEDVYGRRLEILQPRQLDVNKVGSLYVEHAVKGGRETIAALHSLGKEVRIVSGGLRMPVVTFGGWLGVKDEFVHAVKILFDNKGRYRVYDDKSPLTRSDGKREVLAALPPARTAFIGDGMTDAAARDVVDAFICYAGVALRPAVAELADAVVKSSHLAALLPVLCTEAELDQLDRDPRHRPLLALARGGV